MSRYLPVLLLVAVLIATSSQVALAAPDRQGGVVIHRVAWGENLTGIAARYGVTVEAILAQNGLTDPDMIYIGQPLAIPTGGYAGPGSGYNWAPGNCGSYHTVKMGETLSSIAWNYNVSLQSLCQCNNLVNQDVIYLGQTLSIPTAPGYRPEPANYQPVSGPAYYHTVAAGETLSGIAYRYGVDSWALAQANSLSNAGIIWPGQQLVIPGYRPNYAAAPPQPYAAPPQYGPPPGPVHHEEEPYRDSAPKPVYQPPAADNKQTPAAPEYQPMPASAALPEAEHPITVVVNGGETWAPADGPNDSLMAADHPYFNKPDPNGITTLIVHTDDKEGAVVRVRSGDYEVNGESVNSAEFGVNTFTFRYIPPGDYDVWVDDPEVDSEKAQVKVEAGERVDVFFKKQVRFQGQTYASPEGWVLSSWSNPSVPHQNLGGWSNILVKTPASGLNVIAESEGGGYKAKCFTGSKGPGACDFAGLMAGIYYIWIDGTDLTLKTYMDGNAYAVFEFSRQ